MSRSFYRIAASIASLCVVPATAFGQSAAGASHIVVVKLVAKEAAAPYAFEPASVSVQHGDTLRFIEDAAAIHNVRFKTHPAGARLGAASVGPYLTTRGQSYDLVIDARFTDGRYEIVCDPHELLGMRGVINVGTARK